MSSKFNIVKNNHIHSLYYQIDENNQILIGNYKKIYKEYDNTINSIKYIGIDNENNKNILAIEKLISCENFNKSTSNLLSNSVTNYNASLNSIVDISNDNINDANKIRQIFGFDLINKNGLSTSANKLIEYCHRYYDTNDDIEIKIVIDIYNSLGKFESSILEFCNKLYFDYCNEYTKKSIINLLNYLKLNVDFNDLYNSIIKNIYIDTFKVSNKLKNELIENNEHILKFISDFDNSLSASQLNIINNFLIKYKKNN